MATVFPKVPLVLSDAERVSAVIVKHETSNSAGENEYRICKTDADRITDMLRNEERDYQARVSAIEQRLRDIAAGACGGDSEVESHQGEWGDVIDGHEGAQFWLAVYRKFGPLNCNSAETFRQLAERIEASDD